MLAAARNLGPGRLTFRGMVSLDPHTVAGKQYPLLFQSGETANGEPIVDVLHPHDLLMELRIRYARPIGEKAMLNFYYAPVGDAALGPIAFPQRSSAKELPQAAFGGHHLQDAKHLAMNMVAADVTYGEFQLQDFERSGYSGGIRKEYSVCRERLAPKLGIGGWRTGWAGACAGVWMGSRKRLRSYEDGFGERHQQSGFRGYGGVGSRLRCLRLKSPFLPSPNRKRAARSRS